MLKENKWKILITTLIVLLPILVGCLLWDRLPDTIATHFGVDNEPNGFSSKAFAVFGLPGIMAALHLGSAWLPLPWTRSRRISERRPWGSYFGSCPPYR